MADVSDTDVPANPAPDVDATKQALRREMRQLRNGLTDRPERSAAMWSALLDRDDVRAARRVMVFASIPGEPETASLIDLLTSDADRDARRRLGFS